MEKKINVRVMTQIKNIFKVNEADYQKMDKLKAKMDEMQKEYDFLANSTKVMEQRVMDITGGYTSQDLIKTEYCTLVNPDGTPKLDKNGNAIRQKKYLYKYPDTFLPTEKNKVQGDDDFFIDNTNNNSEVDINIISNESSTQDTNSEMSIPSID